MPASQCVGVVDVVGGGLPEAAYVVGGVEHQERPALAEAGVGRAGRVVQRQVDDGRVDRLGRVAADHLAAADDVLELHGGQGRSRAVPDDFERMWTDLAPVGRSASSGGYFRQPFTTPERELYGVVRGAVRGARAAGRERRLRQRRRLVGRRRRPRRPDRLAPGLRARRRRVRRPAGRRLGAGRDRPDALARRRADATGRGVGVRGGGGLAVRAGLPGLAAGGRRDLVGVGPGADRPRRGRARRRRSRGDVVAAVVGRHVRGAARRAGPRPRRPRRGGRGGERDLAARALPVRLHRAPPTTPGRPGWRTAPTRC